MESVCRKMGKPANTEVDPRMVACRAGFHLFVRSMSTRTRGGMNEIINRDHISFTAEMSRCIIERVAFISRKGPWSVATLGLACEDDLQCPGSPFMR